MAKSLYICYFGVDQPLVQTQVIPYLRELVKGGHELTLLTFEPGDVNEEGVRTSLAADGIAWHWLRYHKRPSLQATLFDIANAARFIRKMNAEKKFDILHARSHVPMMMAAFSRKLSRHKPKLLFDIRGFMPEEYVDAGVWKDGGSVYKNVKRVENWMMREADGFVVLTEKARDILADETGPRPVQVIPCCVDLERRFSGDHEGLREKIRNDLGVEGRYVLLHLGALGGLYMVDEIADLLAVAREKNNSTYALFLTQSDPQLIEPLLLERGFSEGDYFIGKVRPDQIEGWLHASDVGLSVVRSSYATASRSPTKIPEYLAAGLPIIANAGVGDVDRMIIENRVGAILEGFTKEDYLSALERIDGLGVLLDEFSSEGYRKAIQAVSALTDVRERCIEVAHREFDLETVGGVRYRRIYERLAN